MPPRPQPKIFQLLVKSHKLTVFLTFPNTTRISAVKQEVLSALTADVTGEVEDIPSVTCLADFELARELKEKGKGTGQYDVLEDDQVLKDMTNNWEVLYIQFKDESGELKPVELSIPDDDELGPPTAFPDDPSSGMEVDMDTDAGPSQRRAKRKDPPS
ncbi:hypothetical protein BV25DRAFT_1844172 [Artomyces pyxidatus]|uniref:Uncharacterized protein n=1 Tax=Artomyces pyxidatus TaxID=48021 RepID=A0ACB8TJL0_9AGAM|nr:hypothetical protein BV25DRAFT_1844172 [Artomyces pyxidatus]